MNMFKISEWRVSLTGWGIGEKHISYFSEEPYMHSYIAQAIGELKNVLDALVSSNRDESPVCHNTYDHHTIVC